ncbi:MAG: hypothetical protein EOM20_06340 [Spartobacteria bacterium]|nr:hypothetical protein [Spartobacteria bacterium]
MKNVLQTNGLMNHILDLPFFADREALFRRYLQGRSVLHVGCSGYPRLDAATNLHIKLCREFPEICGLDVSDEGLDWLRQHVEQPLYYGYDAVDRPFDLVLVPEVMEHTMNPGLFLQQLFAMDAREILLTVPNAIDIVKQNPNKFGPARLGEQVVYVETTHGDHAAYYSPMTLGGLVEKAIAEYAPDRWTLDTLFRCGLSVGCLVTCVREG